jgi:thiamine-monophosphate kinase
MTQGEEQIIDMFRRIVWHPGALGLSDDCAVLPSIEGDLVLKTDAIVGGIHFFDDDPAVTVACKALRVNLSDLAAKGAKPIGFLLAIALPERLAEEWIRSFAEGIGEDSAFYNCPLLGGDTDRTHGAATIAITALGTVPPGAMVARSGAKAGDCIVVTGTIGDAVLGLALHRDINFAKCWQLTDSHRDHLLRRYLLPEPRTTIANAIRQHASAAIDISDGLVGDLEKLCRASHVGAMIEVAQVPLSNALSAVLHFEPELLKAILTGGDDYEILCTMPPHHLPLFRAAAESSGVMVTEIGQITDQQKVHFLSAGRALTFDGTSYSHF